MDLPLKLVNGQLSLDNRKCHFSSYNAVGHEAHFVLEFPLYNPIRYKFTFENVVLGILKLFFNWTIKVENSLYFA